MSLKYRKIAPKVPIKEGYENESPGKVDDIRPYKTIPEYIPPDSSSVTQPVRSSVIYANTQDCNKLNSSEDLREKKVSLPDKLPDNSHHNQPQSQPSSSFKEESNIMVVLDNVHLILPHSASVNLMTIPTHYTREVKRRMKEAENNPNMFTSDIFLVAQIETDFLVTKECVSFYTECGFLDWMVRYKLGMVDPTKVCTAVMEYFVQLVVTFLKNCPHFQSISSQAQVNLLRKNMMEVYIFLMAMSFENKNQAFRWGLNNEDTTTVFTNWKSETDNIVEINQEKMSEYLDVDICKDLFQLVNSLAELETPGHSIILLILISVFTRDGILPEYQAQIDQARIHYSRLLFRYIKTTNSDSSRQNASLHKVLKSVQDLADRCRANSFFN